MASQVPRCRRARGKEEQRARLLAFQDRVKLGLAGNLREYSFVDRTGATVRGDQIDLGREPAGCAASPSEIVNFRRAICEREVGMRGIGRGQ